MNILLVSLMNIDSPTGVTTYYLSLRDEYLKLGHNVLIITPEKRPKYVSLFLKIFRQITLLIKSDILRLSVNEFDNFISIYFAVKKVRNKYQWHIIHGQDPNSSCAAKFAVKGSVPVVMSCHFNDSPMNEINYIYTLSQKQSTRLTQWFRYLFSKIDNYIFVSSYAYNKSSYLLKPEANVRIIQNGVNFFQKKTISKLPESLIISNTGFFEDRKNQIFLIKSAQYLKKMGVAFKVWLIGDGPKRSEWEKFSIENDLSGNVVFLGQKKNVLEIIQESHLYVHTAKNENCGICILEAFSIGLPVLALANGGIPEQFPSSRIGLLASDVEPPELANEIINCFNIDKLRKMQTEQYEYSFSQHTIKQMINQTLSFYNSILYDTKLS